ncbi:MAG TPA: caspase family protein [Bradyrhizobium sp.]|jgi:metacaspase-1|nr:caspase family protein [Bradyrhizobium sp.]
MGKGISLHIGLNSVDPQRYEGWSGPLNACEADANDMADLAQAGSFSFTKLLTRQATREAVLNGIGDAAKNLKSGDIFFLTYSGHGGQAPDLNNEEPDGMDETWCLYDGQLIDDELYSSWGAFASGVRIFLLSDSCHSGTVSKAIHYREKLRSGLPPVYRAMPDEVALRVYQNNKSFYDPILKNRNLSEALSAVKASVLLISGCQDNQLSMDGTFNGLFTGTLKTVWNGGTFGGSYRRFHTAIGSKMPPDQTPKLSLVGASNPAFIAQKPLTLDAPKKGPGVAKNPKSGSGVPRKKKRRK